MLKARGLYTNPNNLSEVPEGALSVADNVVIDRNGIIEPRRGFAQYTNTFGLGTDRAKQLMVYKGRLLVHYSNVLAFDNGSGALTAFSGAYLETQTKLRIKSVEANGNFYFTSNTGVKRISATSSSEFTGSSGYIRNAGAPEALDVTGSVNYDTAGFFQNTTANYLSKVAYRITWAFKDTNGNLVEGAPSSRLVLTNFSSTQSGTVDLGFAVPSDIGTTDTQFFYRIYRTQVSETPAANIDELDPGDEMNLVIEDFPSSGQLTARYVTVNDLTPEDFRAGGELLYSNPVSGEGILQANTPPPFAQDIALYQNTVFYANTALNQQLNLALLGVGDLISGTSTITVTQGITTNVYTFVGVPEITDLTFDTKANTTDGGYFLINAANNIRKYVVWFDKTGTTAQPTGLDTVGRLFVRVDITAATTAASVAAAVAAQLDLTVDFTTSTASNVVTATTVNNGDTSNAVNGTVPVGGIFAINITQQGDGEDQALGHVLLSGNPSPSQAIDETARSLVKIINNNTSGIVNAFYLSGPNDVPGLILLKTRTLTGAAFSLTANSSLTGAQFNPVLPTSGTSAISTNEVEPNAIYYSKFQQPEAVPIVNKFNVGPKDRAIWRILPLRDSLFVLKEDGIYRITGQAGTFSLDPFDNTTHLIAPDSAVVLNNQIYMWADGGIVAVSDTGVSVISRPIENQLDKLASSNYDFEFNTFGVSYEVDRAYCLWTVTNTNDTIPTQCFRFNVFTNSWTKWSISKTCGIVNFADNKLYLGPSDKNFVEQERKNFSRTDYADRQYDLSIPQNGVSNTTVTLSSVQDVELGDVIVQTQKLTIYQFNQLLQKLDLDPNPTYNNYYSTLQVTSGANLRFALDDLAAKLDTDTGVNNTTFVSSLGGGTSFTNLQSDFNIIVNILNTASGVKNTNFPTSQGEVSFEALINEKVKNSNKVILSFHTNLIEGPVVLYRGIKSDVVWVPQSFGDASLMKQIREGTLLFENTVFYQASVGYASDLAPDFEFIDFDEAGVGDWGKFFWGDQNWGGEGSQAPLRTYIPRDKQKCRFLRPRFQHLIGREKFALFGLSLTFRVISERAYKD